MTRANRLRPTSPPPGKRQRFFVPSLLVLAGEARRRALGAACLGVDAAGGRGVLLALEAHLHDAAVGVGVQQRREGGAVRRAVLREEAPGLEPHAARVAQRAGPSGPSRHCGVSSTAQWVHRRRGARVRRRRRRLTRARQKGARLHGAVTAGAAANPGPRPHRRARRRPGRRRLHLRRHGVHRRERVLVRKPLQLLLLLPFPLPLPYHRRLQTLQEPRKKSKLPAAYLANTATQPLTRGLERERRIPCGQRSRSSWRPRRRSALQPAPPRPYHQPCPPPPPSRLGG